MLTKIKLKLNPTQDKIIKHCLRMKVDHFDVSEILGVGHNQEDIERLKRDIDVLKNYTVDVENKIKKSKIRLFTKLSIDGNILCFNLIKSIELEDLIP